MEQETTTPASASASADARIADVAARQHRVVARRQLLAAGVTSQAIRHRLENDRLYQLHRGIYAVGTPRVNACGRRLAAVLASGKAAALSHRSTPEHLRMLDPLPGPVHVTVPGRSSRRRPGIVVHSTRSLPRAEVITRRGIPCTSVERTLIDLAATESAETLARAVEQAFALRLLRRTRMREALACAGGRGVNALERLLRGLIDDLPSTRSELERRFLHLVRDAALPSPVVNRHQATHRVDFAWPNARLVVETDGRDPRQPARLPHRPLA